MGSSAQLKIVARLRPTLATYIVDISPAISHIHEDAPDLDSELLGGPARVVLDVLDWTSRRETCRRLTSSAQRYEKAQTKPEQF